MTPEIDVEDSSLSLMSNKNNSEKNNSSDLK